MLTADTNVWARAYLNDDASQARKARSALTDARTTGGVFVPLLVLAELSWVLRSKWDRERVLNTMEHLLHTRGVTVESASVAVRALEEARRGAAGFADHLIAESSVESGAREIVTFDRAFGRIPGVRLLR